MKPLFIPLRREYFDAFKRREKRVEVRCYGPRWNERLCPVGRRVILSCGYSGARLEGTIRSFKRSHTGSETARAIMPDCEEFALIGIDLH